jgi:hypothetical protein
MAALEFPKIIKGISFRADVILFRVYLTTFSQQLYSVELKDDSNDELGRMWKEAAVALI